MRWRMAAVLCWLAVTGVASARLGESQAQCRQRYGEPVTNYPGCSGVAGWEVYSKDGIAVSAMFVGPTGNTCRAGLVIYSRMAPDARSFLTPPPEITDDEQETLLGTVAGRWEGYEPPAPLGGKPEKLISVSSRPAQILKRRDAARDAVQKAVVSLYPARAGYLCLRMPPKDVGRITGKVFAFRVARGLAICSYDDVPAIMAWADRVAADREAASRAPKSPLSGF